MNAWLLTLLISGGVGAVLAAFAKYCPKAKISEFLVPKFSLAGKLTSKFLLIRLGEKSAEKIEEGIIVTVTTCLSEALGAFVLGLLADNDTKKPEPK